MRKFFYWALALSLTALAWSATPAKKKASGKKGAKASATARKSAAKSPTKSAGVRSGKKAPSKAPTNATTWRNRQLSPTTDRYQEIQQSLAARGYLKADNANGKWDQESIEALKKFQADQNIEASGKINSLSLIALGLGPRREAAPVDLSPPQRQ